MKVLVCGGRDFCAFTRMSAELNKLHAQNPISLVIHGDARGADRLAGQWASNNGIPVDAYPADWNKWGKTAGYHRNKRMLEEGKPDLVVAFEGGRGTEMMMQLALEAGVPLVAIR